MDSTETPRKKRRVMVGAIGKCVHNLGVENFADWMQDMGLGYVSVKLGPAVPIPEVINKIREARPEVVGVSMRLGDLHVDKLINEFVTTATQYGLHPKDSGIRYSFGGLRPAANLVRTMTSVPLEPDPFTPPEERHYDLEQVSQDYSAKPEFYHFFDVIADDYITMEELERFARHEPAQHVETLVPWSDFLVERIRQVRERENRPIIRAHIGIAAETIEPTIDGIEKLADAGALEIVSLAPDQTSQELLAKFIRGEEDPHKYLAGQGGAPIRTVDDLRRLKAATRRGNYPMTRIYSGTDELLELAKLWQEHLNSCFPAVPIFFYNRMDGRGPISIHDSFREHYDVIRYWASVGKPCEINDPHQWGLRYATDDMQVTDHVLVGLMALKLGIKHYVMQMMFELPPEISALDDLAKMKAAYELIEPLTRHYEFSIIKQTRSGLPSFPPDLFQAKGHLAFGIYTQLYLEPEILHVVTHSEAHHEAKAEDIIEACQITKQVCWDFAKGHVPDIWADPWVRNRIAELKRGGMYNVLHGALLGGYEGPITVANFSDWAKEPSEDPVCNYETMLLSFANEEHYSTGTCGVISPDALELALQIGLYQAPHLTVADRKYEMIGKCKMQVVDGTCRAESWDGIPVKDEFQRVDLVRQRFPWYFDKNVSVAADESFITETEAMEEESGDQEISIKGKSIAQLRTQTKQALVVDFGSTFTKVGLFDVKSEKFGLRYVPTTVEDIRIGLANGLGVLPECKARGDWQPLDDTMSRFDVRLPCSSAKGGLKMVTVALTEEESGFAADVASLTAGAKLLASYAGKLTPEQARSIYTVDQPEIILIAGGTDDGGDSETEIHNARLLAENARYAGYAQYGVPVIYAGNQDICEQIENIFRANHVDIRLAGNVMPEVNRFQIEVVNEAIRELFQTVIIRGKGFDVVEKYMDAPFIPTPRAAFRGINLLARGHGQEQGIGNILALDIGGATTDFFSNVSDNPLFVYEGPDHSKRVKRTILKTPNTPLAYRRVEGKYGLAYNAENLKELDRFKNGAMQEELSLFLARRFPDLFVPGDSQFGQFLEKRNQNVEVDLDRYLTWIATHPHMMPNTQLENTARSWLAREILATATRKHVGYVDETETYFLQHGVNFLNQPATVLIIGGTVYHKCQEHAPGYLDDLALIAQGVSYDPAEPNVLRPNGAVLLDAQYLVSILGGLYGRVDPEQALRVMKRELVRLEMPKRAEAPA